MPRPVQGAEVHLRVEAGKVAELRRATGLLEGDPTVAPPTFHVVHEHLGTTTAHLMADAGYDLGRILHGEEHVRYPNGPLRVGDELRGRVEPTGTRRRDGASGPLELVDFRIELRRPDGELAVVVERTLVALG